MILSKKNNLINNFISCIIDKKKPKKDSLHMFYSYNKFHYTRDILKYRDYVYKFIEASICYNHNELILHVDLPNLTDVMYYVKMSSNFNVSQLIDLVVIDQLEEPRFKLVYNLVSLVKNKRFLITTFANDRTEIPSVTKIFKNANWMEREAWDMFGLFFANHPDLRRILTDYGFKGHPLRKDFPLSGYVELWYSDDAGYTVYEPIRLSQQLRFFNFTSLWEFN